MHYFFQKSDVRWQNLLEKQNLGVILFRLPLRTVPVSRAQATTEGACPSVPDAMIAKNKSRLSLKLYLKNF